MKTAKDFFIFITQSEELVEQEWVIEMPPFSKQWNIKLSGARKVVLHFISDNSTALNLIVFLAHL